MPVPVMDDSATLKGDNFNESGTGAPPTAGASPAAGSMVPAPAAGGDQAPPPAIDSSLAGSNGEADPSQPAAGAAPSGMKDSTTIKAHSFGNGMLRGILGALGGSEDRMYSRDPQTGKLVVTAVKSGPGSQWKRIIAGALTGAAAGASVRPGPGNLGRAAGAGFAAGNDMATGIDERKREDANQDFEANQRVMTHKAQQALLTQQIASSAWEMKRSQIGFSMDMAKDTNAFNAVIASDPSHQDLGVFPSLNEFIDKNSGKDTAKGLTDGVLQAFPEIDDKGNVVGVHGYRVTPGWGQKRNTEPVQIDLGGPVNGKWEPKYQTIPANAYTNEEILAKQKAVAEKKSQWEKEKYQQEQENKRNQTSANASVEAAKLHSDATVKAAEVGADSREKVAKIKQAGVGQTLTSNTRTMMETAPKVIGLIDKLDALITKNSEEIGPESGRFNEIVTGKGGLDNPEYTRIRTDAGLLSTLVMKMHLGARGGSQSIAYFKDLLANAAQSPANYHAALQEVREYAQMVAGAKEGENIVVGKEAPTPAPAGASDEVYKDGALIGHVVNNKFVPLEKQK